MRSSRRATPGGAQDRYRLAGGAVGLAEAGNRQPAPDDETIRKLVVEAMMRFDEAVRAKSFNDFFDHISRRWQLQLVHSYEAGFDYDTAMRRPLEAGEHELGSAHFDRVFRAFMESSVDLSSLRGNIAPVLAPPPRLSTEALLLVSGYFPAQPNRVNFALKFIYESPSWRLFGLDVNLDDPRPLRDECADRVPYSISSRLRPGTVRRRGSRPSCRSSVAWMSVT